MKGVFKKGPACLNRAFLFKELLVRKMCLMMSGAGGKHFVAFRGHLVGSFKENGKVFMSMSASNFLIEKSSHPTREASCDLTREAKRVSEE